MQRRAMMVIKGLEHLSYDEKLAGGTVQPVEKKAQEKSYPHT